MRADRLRNWAGVGLLALLGVAPLRAQELPPAPDRPAALTPGAADRKLPTDLDLTPAPVPTDAPTIHSTDCHTTPAEEAERGWASGLFFDADYLLIKPRRNALDYAVVAPNRDQIPSGSVESLEWELRSAFRFGLGYELANSWRLGVHYTYLHSTDSATVNAPAGGAVYATLTRAGTFDQVATATATANLNYNVIDVEASKFAALCDSLGLNVFGGARVAWIDQKFSATYNGGPFGANNATVDTPVFFEGAGLTLGAEAVWKIYRGLGLYGRARGSLLSGRFRNFLTETNNNGQNVIVDVRERYYQLVPVLELGAGVSFQTEHVYVGIGYDVANWFNMTDSLDFPSTNIGKPERRTSDLMLEGLSVRLGVIF
jgi:hypothetical protein